MTNARESPGIRIERVQRTESSAFDELLRIYRDAIPTSERKNDDVLREMLARDDYEFHVATLDSRVVGFTIVKKFRGCDASLLEYMAVDRDRRGGGVGGTLFREASAAAPMSSRYVLVEVEDETEPSDVAEDTQRRRRKAFYRVNGCREVAGLAYSMPTVSAERPPKMNLLVYRRRLPRSIDKAELRRWLQSIYVEVYGQSASDVRIERMLAPLADRLSLV